MTNYWPFNLEFKCHSTKRIKRQTYHLDSLKIKSYLKNELRVKTFALLESRESWLLPRMGCSLHCSPLWVWQTSKIREWRPGGLFFWAFFIRPLKLCSECWRSRKPHDRTEGSQDRSKNLTPQLPYVFKPKRRKKVWND